MRNHRQHRRNFVAVLFFSVIFTFTSAFSADPIDIGNRLELFTDDYLIESTSGDVHHELMKPEAKEVVMTFDKSWEGGQTAYFTTFKDGDKLCIYYRGSSSMGAPDGHPNVSCFAESTDGINVVRPNLGLVEFDGTTNNNIIDSIDGQHDFSPFLDKNPTAAGNFKYRSVARDQFHTLSAYNSPDGLNWTLTKSGILANPSEGIFDSQNITFWDPVIGKYRAYWRYYSDPEGAHIRAIRTGVSDDFINWTDLRDLTYTNDTLDQHLYTNSIETYFRAPHITIGFPARYYPEDSSTAPLFMSSRDGHTFNRYSDEVIPRTALANRDGNRSNFASWGLVYFPSRPREISMYATENYHQTYVSGQTDGRLRRFVYRVDGFVAVRGDSSGGQMTTKALNYDGQELLLNYVVRDGGSLIVDVLDESGTLIGKSNPLTGDAVDSPVTWQDNPNLSSGIVKLRFNLIDADLFSIRFNASTSSDYTLEVINGTGDGNYQGGASVTITADSAPEGSHFTKWIVNGLGSIDDATSTTTVFTMPFQATSVTASYAVDGVAGESVLEDAEDGDVVGWSVYDISPEGASITNIVDPDDAENRIIKLTGEFGNGFKYTFDSPITEINELQWNMKFSSAYEVYIQCQTTAGERYLRYTPVSNNLLGADKYIDFGLGENTTSGDWYTVSRNIIEDIHAAQPATNLISVDAFLVRGPGYVDDIILFSDAAPSAHIVNFVIGEHGTRTGGGELIQSVADGADAVAPTVSVDAGWTWGGWDTPFNNVTSDLTVTAIIMEETLPSYLLSYDAGANGSLTGNVLQTVTQGEDATTVTAVANSGYHFSVWTDGVTTASRTDTNITHDISVTASFAEDGGTPTLTVLEDAEDGDTSNWAIYDADPAGATITNILDPTDSSNRIISLVGTDLYNGFQYTFEQPITETSNIQWRMRCSEAYEIFIECQTTSGLRYLRYKPISVNGLGTDKYIDFGLGESTIAGNWVTISRDIAADIHEAQPGTDLISMDAFLVRGTSLIDDIAKGTSEDTTHSADTNNDWSISQTEVDAFIADYANNSNTVSGGNGSFDDANRITMRETLRVIYLYNGGGAYKGGQATVDTYNVDGAAPAGDAAASTIPLGNVISVTNSTDSGAGSLRNTIANSVSGDTITFDESVEKIVLTSEILIDRSITLDGNGITIVNGNNKTRIFRVHNEDEDIFVLLLNMGIVDGENSIDEFGGAIYNNGENLTLENCLFNSNANIAENGKGGAVYTSGSLTVINCVFTDNRASEENDIYSTNE